MNTIENLLSQVKLFNFKYEKVFEEYQYHFNIFSILMKDNDEVNLHSKFIYELLNPNGIHKQKYTFLKLFLNEFDINDFDLEDVVIYKEYKNIDILIKNKTQAIIIENKLDSNDHSEQLNRYFKFLKDKKNILEENITIIYLTKFGSECTEENEEFKKITKNIKLASYDLDIFNWIKESIEKMEIYPIIRETLFQYENLIKKLTNQSQLRYFICDIKNLLDNLDNKENIKLTIEDIKTEIQYKFWKELQVKLEEEFENELSNSTFVHCKEIKNCKPDDKDIEINDETEIKKIIKNFYTNKRNKYNFGLKTGFNNIQFLILTYDDHVYYTLPKSEKEKIIYSNGWSDKKTDFLIWKNSNCKHYFNSQEIFDLANEIKRKGYIVELTNEIEQIINDYKALKDDKNGK